MKEVGRGITKFLTMKILLALLLFSGLAWGENRDVSEGNVKCKILGHSGKMMFSLKDQEFNTSDEVVVEMDQVVEVASGGSAAAGKGNKHKVTSFANQDFEFTGSEDGKYKDLDVKKIKFNSSISNMEGASLTVLLFIFKQSGDILNGDEVAQVEKGTIKFNIELKNWKFCEGSSSDCNSKGVAVDFTITVKSKGKPEKKSRPKSSKYPDKKQPENYDLENANMQFSRMVLFGGNVTEMEAGYPKHKEKNKKQSFTFRFPRFNGTLTYDPIIELTSGGNGGQTANVLNVLLIALSLALAGLLA